MMKRSVLILVCAAALAPAQTLPAKKSANYDSSTRDGRFDLRARVDGRCEFYIRGDEIRYRVRGGRDPVDAGSEYRKEIPRGELVGLKLEKRDGRGSIRILEEPSRGNNYTLIIEIDDPAGGDARYHARITWEDARDFENPFERGRSSRSSSRSGSTTGSTAGSSSTKVVREQVSAAPQEVDELSSGRGDLQVRDTRDYLRGASLRVDRNNAADITLETENGRSVRFRGRVRSRTATSINIDLEDSDLGRASGTAAASMDASGRLSSLSMNGRAGNDSFNAMFRR